MSENKKPTSAELEKRIRLLEDELVRCVQGQEALEDEATLRRVLFENSPDGILIINPKNARFLDFNTAAHQQLGYSREEFANLSIMDIEAKETASETKKAIATVLKNGRADFETLQRTRQGEIRNVYVSAQIVNVQGRSVYHCVWRDITEHKRAEELLRASERRFWALFEESVDGVFITSPEGRLVDANKAGIKMFGYDTKEEMLQLDLSAHLYANPQDREHFFSTLRERGSIEFELKFKKKGGEIMLAHLSSSSVKDGHDKVLFLISVIHDITKIKRAEQESRDTLEALRKTEETLSSVFKALPLGLCVVENRIFRNVNEAYLENMGYSEVEIIGHSTRLVYENEEEYDRVGRELYDDLLERGQASIQTVHRRKNGDRRDIILTAVPLQSTNSKLGLVVVTIEDITERKQLEDQLRQSQKMEAIGTLAGGIAHDFNNILSAVLGYADLALREPSVSEHLRKDIEMIYNAGAQAAELVRQILTFSRQNDENLYPLKVGPVVKEVLKLLRSSIPTTIDIQEQIKADPDIIMANPSCIHQILMNLCTNASQAMKGRKGILKVILRPVDVQPDDPLISRGLSPGMHLNLIVSDTGHGIAPEIIEKIFDPFFTTKKPGEGTGMGLSVVHGIVKRCGGAVTVQSAPGKGARFSVYFPLLTETQRENKKAGAMGIVGGTESILYVDDDKVIAQLGIGMLTSIGYKVFSRTSSIEALELFKSRPEAFDLVVTDMTMPRMTGVELAQEIMRIRPDMPVILCTGFSEVVTPENAREFGLREVIMKPIILDRLASAIRRELDKKT